MKLDEMLEFSLWRVTTGNSHSGVYWATLWKYFEFYDLLSYVTQGQGVDAESAMRDLVDIVEQSQPPLRTAGANE